MTVVSRGRTIVKAWNAPSAALLRVFPAPAAMASTLSPTFTSATSLPTATTSPARSEPRMKGRLIHGNTGRPVRYGSIQSTGLTATAWFLTTISPAPGSG
ncbi:MAG TPA: hypothetical protein VGF33_01115 [Caulobacteraceae bacterium]